MELDQKLASLKFLGVHAVQKHPLSRLLPQVFAIELRRHRAPYLGTLNNVVVSMDVDGPLERN
jgi:hypothetical protein